jgi:hypothetical protein
MSSDLVEETKDESESIAKQILKECVLARLEKYIDEKISHIKTRKTWNLKRQEEQFELAKQRRTQWKVEETGVRARLQKLCGSNVGAKELDIPVTLAIERCVADNVRLQEKLINKCLLHYAHRHMGLLRYLDAFR